jgi:hypothetical protein
VHPSTVRLWSDKVFFPSTALRVGIAATCAAKSNCG